MRLSFNLTYSQKLWLTQHGDRNVLDVEADEKGLYVIMWYGPTHEEYKVYLPE